jgi:UDP-3-O-[3-hydroxymyristoyl] N-acetylglucosamine deacetylase
MTSLLISGVGLHSGVTTKVRVMPAPLDSGLCFVRVDLPHQPRIPVRLDAVRQTILSTELGVGEARVRTVEHLLASLTGLGVKDAQIEVDGAELPLLDGSAKLWVEAIANSDLVRQPEPFPKKVALAQPVSIYQGEIFVAAIPSPTLRFTYGIDFDSAAIGNQWYSWTPSLEGFSDAIAPARTFALLHQIKQLQESGLIKGGSLENALVCDQEKWLNPPLRFPNEPVRHKLLDFLGDLSLLGSIPTAHYLAYKASHNLHIQLAKAIWEQMKD